MRAVWTGERIANAPGTKKRALLADSRKAQCGGFWQSRFFQQHAPLTRRDRRRCLALVNFWMTGAIHRRTK